MSQKLYSVVEVAELLGLHVRTVRNYVREGRLKATRIGKQYRIAREDLEALTGEPAPALPREDARRTRHIDASSVVQIHAIAPDAAARVCDGVTAALKAAGKPEPRARLTCDYDEERARLKLIISGDLAASAGLMQLLQLYIDQ